MDDYEAVSPVEDGKRKYRFNIHNNNKSTIRVFRLYAESQLECLQWMRAIEQVFKVLHSHFYSFSPLYLLIGNRYSHPFPCN